MRPPPRLSNVYTPAVLPQQQQSQPIDALRHRCHRAPHELRRLHLTSGLIELQQDTSGSALVQLGHTQVLCTVTGPVTAASSRVPNHLCLTMDEGVLHVEVQYAPASPLLSAAATESSVTPIDPSEAGSSAQRGRYAGMVQSETDLATRVSAALQAAVPLRPYPKCALVVRLTVLQDDGGVLPSGHCRP